MGEEKGGGGGGGSVQAYEDFLNWYVQSEFVQWLLISLMITVKFSVMIGTLPYVFGSCERLSKLTEEMYIPLRPIPKEDSLRR